MHIWIFYNGHAHAHAFSYIRICICTYHRRRLYYLTYKRMYIYILNKYAQMHKHVYPPKVKETLFDPNSTKILMKSAGSQDRKCLTNIWFYV